MAPRRVGGQRLEPSSQEVVEAVRSLYADELRPMGRILLRRLRERAAAALAEARGLAAGEADPEAVPLVDPAYLRRLCEHCGALLVLPAEGKEYSVELRGARGAFVEPLSERDPYPGSLWCEFGNYIAGLSAAEGTFPSGRYACAQVLRGRALPCLQGRSLGELCHIVQLSISHRKILGYANGSAVPYSMSDECRRLRCAVRQQPSDPAAGDDLPYASWEDLVSGLHALLIMSRTPMPGAVAVSSVKRLFRTQLGLELSETVLGHSKIGDLLQDPRLSHCCCLRAAGNGQTWVCLADSAMGVLPVSCIPAAAASGSPYAAGGWSTCASNRAPALATAPPLPLVPAAAAPLAFLATSPGDAGLAACVAPAGWAGGWGRLPMQELGCSDGGAVLAAAADGAAAADVIAEVAAPSAGGAAGGLHSPGSSAASEGSLPEDAAAARRGGKGCGSSATSSATLGSLDSGSESGDSAPRSPVVLGHYGVVVKNGFLEEASPRRRHARCRSA